MNIVRAARSWSAAACVLLWSCTGDPLVGANHCYGDDIVCKSDAPTLSPWPSDASVPGSVFDIVAARTAVATWTFDVPACDSCGQLPQVSRARNGGVWATFSSPLELLHIDAEGELVQSYTLAQYGILSVDDELNPVVLSRPDARHMVHFSVSGRGETSQRTVSLFDQQPSRGYEAIAVGPGGRLRYASFREHGSYTAEYDPQGDLLWQQTEMRDARDYPFEDLGVGYTPVVSYGAVTLSDGAIALSVPKYLATHPGLDPSRLQGITLLEADGNLRWDLWMSQPSFAVRLAPGLDGGVVVANGMGQIQHFDRDGSMLASWFPQHVGYYDSSIKAMDTDPAGDIYAVFLTGSRKAAIPVVCRMRVSDPHTEVVCLAVEGVPLDGSQLGGPGQLSVNVSVSITAPEAGSVVLAIHEADNEAQTSYTRLVRLDF